MTTENQIKKEDQKTVLVVEDETALREAIKLKLEREGISVVQAGSGEEALNKIKEQKPNLVWLDILLPGMNGLEVLRKIRQELGLKDLPVVVVSVSVGREKIEQALALNAVDYITKSGYNIAEIIKRVKKFL